MNALWYLHGNKDKRIDGRQVYVAGIAIQDRQSAEPMQVTSSDGFSIVKLNTKRGARYDLYGNGRYYGAFQSFKLAKEAYSGITGKPRNSTPENDEETPETLAETRV